MESAEPLLPWALADASEWGSVCPPLTSDRWPVPFHPSPSTLHPPPATISASPATRHAPPAAISDNHGADNFQACERAAQPLPRWHAPMIFSILVPKREFGNEVNGRATSPAIPLQVPSSTPRVARLRSDAFRGPAAGASPRVPHPAAPGARVADKSRASRPAPLFLLCSRLSPLYSRRCQPLPGFRPGHHVVSLFGRTLPRHPAVVLLPATRHPAPTTRHPDF